MREARTDAWIEISESALRDNLAAFRRAVGPDVLIAPCVKANAYGHGIGVVAPALERAGADWFCVHSLREAERLWELGVSLPVLIMGPVHSNDYARVLEIGARVFVTNAEDVHAYARIAEQEGRTGLVHVKVDTGMGRQGVVASDALALLDAIDGHASLSCEGLATHFATADDFYPSPFLLLQLRAFETARDQVESRGHRFRVVHMANTAAAILYPETHGTMIRPGIGIYGCVPDVSMSAEFIKRGVALTPALSFRARVAAIKTLPSGHALGYGATTRLPRASKIAILPIGYYDGIDRRMGNNGAVIVRGIKAPIVGRISMDFIAVDVTDIPDALTGDTATVIGKDGSACICDEDIASAIGTIPYEVTTRLPEHLPRRLVD